MSTKSLRDHSINTALGLHKKIDGKGNLTKLFNENITENGSYLQKKTPSCFYIPSNYGDAVGSNGTETRNSEVEYIESENLVDLLDVNASFDTLLARLDSKDWVSVCEALNNVRQLSMFHEQKLHEDLGSVILLIVKSLKSSRSAICKTAILACVDIFTSYNDKVIDLVDPLLVQLLLKSSQDKRFVCEAAVAALIALTTSVSPTLLLPKLLPYLSNKNPPIRAKTSMCFSRSVSRLVGCKLPGSFNCNVVSKRSGLQRFDQVIRHVQEEDSSCSTNDSCK